MEDKTINTPVVEDKTTTAETTVEKKPMEAEQPKKEESQQTVAEIIENTDPEEKRVVEEHIFVAEKKARKAAEKELKVLKESIKNGATDEDISDSISEIADEHNIDAKFLQKLASSIKAEAEKELDAKYASKFEGKEKVERFEVAFGKQYDIAMERAPEFKAIANTDTIKTLALLPQNSKKTLSQILEETYGNALTGKRTVENTITPGGGKEPEPLDYKRAEKDIGYFKEVMADPKRKAEYNEMMLKKGF